MPVFTKHKFYAGLLCPSKAVVIGALCTVAFLLQTSERKVLVAHEFLPESATAGRQATKADKWDAPQSQTLQGMRLAHLWDGTPESTLKAMVAPVHDINQTRVLVAYAPPAISVRSDALDRLSNFGVPDKEAASIPPRPLSRPNGLRPSFEAPPSILGTMPPQADLKTQNASALPQQEIKLASLEPVAVPVPNETRESLSTLNLPYILQTASVQTNCFPEKLVKFIQVVETHYGKKVIVTSGMRDHGRVGSLHRHCAAADIIVPGVSGASLAAYARTIPDIGGVGQYCHPYLVHMDVGSRRDWTYACAKKSTVVAAQSASDNVTLSHD